MKTVTKPSPRRRTKCPKGCGSLERLGMPVRELAKEVAANRRWVKKLRKLGASNHEIAAALGITEENPVLNE